MNRGISTSVKINVIGGARRARLMIEKAYISRTAGLIKAALTRFKG